MTPREVRSQLDRALQLDLVGPGPGDETLASEVLPHPPSRRSLGQPCVSGNRLFVERGNRFVCLALADGSEIWNIFFGDGAGRLWAIDRATGEPQWRHRPPEIQSAPFGIPAVLGRRLYFGRSHGGGFPGRLYCYEEPS